VLGRFTDPQHSPAVVAREFGEGTVLMVYTTASMRWNDWAADEPPGLYVAPMLDMVAYLARGQVRRSGCLVGLPIAFELGREMRNAQAWLQTPAYPQTDRMSLRPRRRFEPLVEQIDSVARALKPVEPTAAGALAQAGVRAGAALAGGDVRAAGEAIDHTIEVLRRIEPDRDDVRKLLAALRAARQGPLSPLLAHELRYDRAVEAGVYGLDLQTPEGKTKRYYFARNSDPAEGNLQPGGVEAIASALGSEEFLYVPRRNMPAAMQEDDDSRREYWRWAVGAMLALLAVETVLAQRFGHHSHERRN
jgi:hypothetical protein